MRYAILSIFVAASSLIACSESPSPDDVTPAEVIDPKPGPDTPSTESQKDITSKHQPLAGIEAELAKTHDPRNAIEAARNSTLFIDTQFGTGSAFFYKDDCLVVTNKHVVKLDDERIRDILTSRNEVREYLEMGIASRDDRHQLTETLDRLDKAVSAFNADGSAKTITATLVNGRQVPAKVLAYSSQYDLAYLQLKAQGCRPLAQFSDASLPLGHKVFTIGNPIGLKYSVTSGIISGEQEHHDILYLQTDAAINPGNSGGPLIDQQGRLVGVNTLVMSNSQGIGFALPLDSLNDDYELLKPVISRAKQDLSANSWRRKSVEATGVPEYAKDAHKICVSEYDRQEWGGAIDQCKIAAEAGIAQAEYLYADMLLASQNIEKRLAAVSYIKKAAAAGYAEALYMLGILHSEGEYMPKNPNVAFDLFLESCEKQYGAGCNSAAIVYLSSFQLEKAWEHFDKGERLGEVMSIFNKAFMTEKGKHVEKNEHEAYQLYRKAALLGSNIAQFKLFFMHYEGVGTARDYEQAYAWVLVSELDEQSREDAIPGWRSDIPADVRHFFERMLNSEQKKKGYARAEQLRKKIAINADKRRVRHRYQRETGYLN